MKWLLSTVAATLLIFSAGAPAQSSEVLSGKALAEGCQANEHDRMACLAYMAGFTDGFVSNDWIMTTYLKENLRAGYLTVSATAERVEKPAYCVDDQVPAEIVRQAYLDWAAANPEELDQPASSALFHALSAAFPCSGEPAASGHQTVSLRY